MCIQLDGEDQFDGIYLVRNQPARPRVQGLSIVLRVVGVE